MSPSGVDISSWNDGLLRVPSTSLKLNQSQTYRVLRYYILIVKDCYFVGPFPLSEEQFEEYTMPQKRAIVRK